MIGTAARDFSGVRTDDSDTDFRDTHNSSISRQGGQPFGLTTVMASPRPMQCAPRSPAMSPWHGTDPDSRDSRSRCCVLGPVALVVAAARCRVLPKPHRLARSLVGIG